MEDTFQLFNIEFWKPYSIVEDALTEYLDYLQAIYLQGDRKLENFEIHHIVPKSIDQNLERCCFNMLKLTGREHFTVHRLLLSCFQGSNKSKMYYAYNMMCGRFGTVFIDSAEDYEQFRSEFRQVCVENNSGCKNPNYGKKHPGVNSGVNNPNYGNIYTQEFKDYLSQIKKGSSNPMFGKEHSSKTKKLIGNNSKGRVWINNGTTNKFVKPEEVEYYTK